jgi:hypothetical protein
MASSYTFKFTGLQDTLKKLGDARKTLKEDVTQILNESAKNIETLAKQNAPKNMGTLAQSVNSGVEENEGNIIMYVGTPFYYGAFIEFGTGGKVSTRGYEDYASTFQGVQGGSMAEFIKALVMWVQKKGLAGTYSVKTRKRTGGKSKQQDENLKVAWAIAISILNRGLNPHPWLFPAFESEIPNLTKNIKNYADGKS